MKFNTTKLEDQDENQSQDLSSYPYLSRKFVKALDLALEDVGVSVDDHDTLFDIIQDSFENIIRLSSTITQAKGPVSELLTIYVDHLHKKLQQVAESTIQAQDADIVTPTKQQLLSSQKTLLEKIQVLLAKVMTESLSRKGLTYHSAHFLISFVLRVMSPQKVIRLESNSQLNWQLCLIADQLFNESYNYHFHHDCQLLLSFIENAPNYDREAFTKQLSEDTTIHYSRIYLLCLTYSTGKGCDAKLRDYLMTQHEKLVLNDKNKDAFNSVKLFEPFYQQIDEKLYLTQIHASTQFCCNRSGLLLPNITHMVQNFTFKLTTETAEALTYQLVSKDQIQNNHKGVLDLFKVVCEHTADTQTFASKIVGFLISEFDKVKLSSAVTPADKMKILELASVCSNTLNTSPDTCASAIIDLLLNSKDQIEVSKDTKQVIQRSGANCYQLLKAGASKISFANQVQLLIENRLYESGAAIMSKLSNLNFEIAANTSVALSMIRFVCDSGLTQDLIKNENVARYLISPTSPLNQPTTLKRLSCYDISHHLRAIQCLLSIDLKANQIESLEAVLIEYLLNKDYVFRGYLLWECFQKVQAKWSEQHLVSVLKAVFARVHKSINEQNVDYKQSCSLAKKIRNFLSFVVPRQIKLSVDTFVAVLQLISHPAVSANATELKVNSEYVIKISKMPFKAMVEDNCDVLINQFLKERTGILSPDTTVRQIAVNVLGLMCNAGFLSKILPEMMPIFSYKPVEMIEKLEKLLVSEFDKISHYDLMFYAEITRDMLGMYKEKDEKCIKIGLNQKDESAKAVVEETKTPEVQIAADDDMDPALQAMLAKASKSKKGKGKVAGGKPAATPAPQAAPKPKVEAAPEISKEERNKLDRKQMIDFITQMRQVKARQINACYSVLKLANKAEIATRLNYQEATLAYLTGPLLKLLNLKATRFDSIYFTQNLLNESRHSPFFPIKGSLLQGLIAVADNKLSSRSISDISQCLQNLNKNADFSEMGVGSLKICLTISNFVLKDPSVNLSVKEIGLNVAQSILMDNTCVQMIDLVRLTVNMLKTNYISQNLNGFIRKLIRRTNKIEIAILLQPLFEYQPVPRKVLLTELYAYDEPLFNPVWFATQMWMLLFDEELGGLARKIFNKFGITLRGECLDLALEKETLNIFHYLRSTNFGVFSLTTKAVGSAMEIYRQSQKLTKIVDDLTNFYRTELKIIAEESRIAAEMEEYGSSSKVQQSLRSDQRMNRIAIPQIFGRTAKLFQPQHFVTILTFLVTESSQDENQEIREASNKAALTLIKVQGEEYANQLLAVLETFLNATEGLASNDASKNQAVILLGHLAQFLGDTAQKKLITSYEKLVDLLNKSSPLVQKAICKCIPQLAKFFTEKARVYLTNQMIILRTSKDEKQLRSSSYAVAGLAKSQGMSYVVEVDLFGQIYQESFQSKKAESIRKCAGLYFYDAMSFIMGHSFEVFLPNIFPNVLAQIADQKEQVRTAALGTLKTIMTMFSNYAIKQALPQFLSELKNDNWRSKFSTVEALGNMAYCAPKQISSFLPQIVKGLREVLNDTHEKVHEAAIEAIKKIGSVIKCPEIGDMLEIIIKALANTNKYLNEALNLVLETSFAHAIDAPSLSLLVPLLDAGLTMHDNTSKQMAATLMGNICSLTQDPQDLLPYMSILVPAIKTSLFDVIPEIRASAAKALGRLSKGLGTDHSVEMLGWLREHLDKKQTSSAEKSGAAQGFAEMISSHGNAYFEHYIDEVIKKSQDQQSYLREAYRGVLVFLPGCFDNYVTYLSMLVPIMIEGLADDVDEVRKVSMRNVKICIKKFAKTTPFELVNPVMTMMFSTDFRVRESSSILMFQLVKELENDVIKTTPTYIDQDTKHRILSSLFILKYDPIEKVYTQASQIWKGLIDNQLTVLKQVIDTCIQIIFQIIQSPSSELQEMGLSCIRGIVEKMGEKLVLRAIEIFENLLDKATDKTQSVGICRVMYNMAGSATHRLLQIIAPRLVQILDPYLSAEQAELREWSSKVFITLFQRQSEKSFVDPVLDKSILQKLKQFTAEKKEEEAERIITTLRYLVDKAPGLKIEDRMLVLCDITDKKTVFSIAQARIIRALAQTFASRVFSKKFYFAVLVALQEELSASKIDDQERIQYVVMAYSELLARIPENEAMQTNEELERFLDDCQTLNRPGFYLDMISHYCENTETNYEKNAEEYMENVLKYINYPDEKLVSKVITAVNSIMSKLPKENQMLLVPLIRRQFEINGVQVVNTLHSIQNEEGNIIQHLYKKKCQQLMILKQTAGVQSIVNYVQAAIMHGSVQIRIDAAFTFKYILEFSEPVAIKKEIIKICGALIRVVNDKFPLELKVQIFLALKLIQQKYADSAKAMAAQLQTTFLKALGDNTTTPHAQNVVIENLILLVKGLPRVDPIVKELVSLLDGPKIDGQQKELVSECLALLIRAKGKSITSTMSETIVTQLDELVQQSSDLNDVVLCNCAVALGYLSAYAADSNQMATLFKTYQGRLAVSVGVKFGVLTNGNETISKDKMAQELKVLLVDCLKAKSGFDAVDKTEDEDEIFRFAGAFDMIGHLSNSFGRRDWCQAAQSPYLALLFSAFNEAGTLKQLQTESECSSTQFQLLLKVLAQIPIKMEQLSAELSEFIKDGFLSIQKFYLDHPQLNAKCTDAILNMLQLTYDNFLEVQNIRMLDRPAVKEATLSKTLEGIISDDMRMYALDIVFRKK